MKNIMNHEFIMNHDSSFRGKTPALTALTALLQCFALLLLSQSRQKERVHYSTLHTGRWTVNGFHPSCTPYVLLVLELHNTIEAFCTQLKLNGRARYLEKYQASIHPFETENDRFEINCRPKRKLQSSIVTDAKLINFIVGFTVGIQDFHFGRQL
jgi:hypothetical protein